MVEMVPFVLGKDKGTHSRSTCEKEEEQVIAPPVKGREALSRKAKLNKCVAQNTDLFTPLKVFIVSYILKTKLLVLNE